MHDNLIYIKRFALLLGSRDTGNAELGKRRAKLTNSYSSKLKRPIEA